MEGRERTVRIVAKARSQIDRINKDLQRLQRIQRQIAADERLDIEVGASYSEVSEARREVGRLERTLQKAKLDRDINVSDEEIQRLERLMEVAQGRVVRLKVEFDSRSAEERVAELTKNMARWRQMQADISDDASNRELLDFYKNLEKEQQKVLASSRKLAGEISSMELPRGFRQASGDISRFNRNLESSISVTRRLAGEARASEVERAAEIRDVEAALKAVNKAESDASKNLQRNFERADSAIKMVNDRLYKFQQQIQRAFTEIDPSNMERDFGKIRANLASFSDELNIKGGDFLDLGLDDFSRQIEDAKSKVGELRASITEGEMEIPADIQLARFEAKKEKIERDIAQARSLQLIVLADIETDRFSQSYSALKRQIASIEAEIIKVQAEFDVDDADLQRMRNEVTGLRDARIQVAADITEAERDLGFVLGLAKIVDRTRAKLHIDSDTRKLHTTIVSLGLVKRGAEQAADAFENKLNRSMRMVQNLLQILIRLMIAFVFSAISPLTAGLLALAGAAGLAGIGLGAVALAAAPLISNISNHEQAVEGLRSAQESLADAQDRYKDAQDAYADSQVEGARAIKDAQEDVRDSREAAVDAEVEGNRQIAESREALADAHEDHARLLSETRRDVKDAARDYADSQKAYAESEVEARELVIEAVEGLREAERELASVRKEVAADIRESYKDYLEAEREVQAVRKEVAEEVRESYQDYLEAEREISVVRREVAQEAREMDQAVMESRRELSSTIEDTQDSINSAYESWRDSVKAVADAEEDARERVADAVERHNDALKNLSDVRVEAAEYVRDTHADAREAVRDLEDAEYALLEARERVRDATIEFVEAQKDLNEALRGEPTAIREMELELEADRLSAIEVAQRRAEAEENLRQAMAVGDLEQVRRLELEIAQLRNQGQRDALANKKAEDELSEARRSGSDELNSAWDALEGAYDARREAERGLEDAQVRLQEQQRAAAAAQIKASRAQIVAARMIAEALEGVRESAQGVRDAEEEGVESVRDAREKAADDYEAYRDAQIDGAEAIRRAERGVSEAIRARSRQEREGAARIREAQEAAKEAYQSFRDTQIEGAKRIREAQEAAKEAYKAYRDAQVDGAERIKEAEESVKEAREGVVEAVKEGREIVRAAYQAMRQSAVAYKDAEVRRSQQIADSLEAIEDAEAGVAEARVAKAEAVEEAQDNLRDSVIALRDTERKTRESTVAAFGDLQDAAEDLKKAIKDVNAAADEPGARLKKWEKALLNRWESFKKGIVKEVEPASKRLAEILIEVMDFSERYFPLVGEMTLGVVEGIGRAVDHFFELLDRPRSVKSIEKIAEYVPRFTEDLAFAAGELGTALINMLAEVAPEAENFAEWVREMTTKFRRWTEGDMSGALKKMFEDAAPFFDQAQETIAAIWDLLVDIASDDKIKKFAIYFLELIETLAKDGSIIKVPLRMLTNVMWAINAAAKTTPGRWFITATALILAFTALGGSAVIAGMGKLGLLIYTLWKYGSISSQMGKLATSIDDLATASGRMPKGAVGAPMFDTSTRNAKAQGGKLARFKRSVLRYAGPALAIAALIAIAYYYDYGKSKKAFTKARDDGKSWGESIGEGFAAGMKDIPLLGPLITATTNFGKKMDDEWIPNLKGGGRWHGIFGKKMQEWTGMTEEEWDVAKWGFFGVAMTFIRAKFNNLKEDLGPGGKYYHLLPKWLQREKDGADAKNEGIKWGSIGSFIMDAIISKIPLLGVGIRVARMLGLGKKRGDEKNENTKWGGIGSFILRTILSKIPGGGLALRLIDMLTKGKQRGDEKNQNIKWGGIGAFILRTILSKIPGGGIALRIISMLTKGKTRGDEKNQNIKWGGIGGFILRAILSKIPGGGIALRVISMLTKGKARGDEKNQNIKWGGIGGYILRTILSKLPGGGIALRLLDMIGKGKSRADEKNRNIKWGGIGSTIWNLIKSKIPLFGLGARLAEMLGKGKEKADDRNGRIKWGGLGSGIIGDIMEGMRERWPDFVDWLKNIGGGDWAKPAFKPLGYNMLAGIIGGMSDNGPSLISRAADWVKRAWESMRDAAKNRSPSRLTRPEGYNMIMGLIVGMDSAGPEATRKAAEVVGKIAEALRANPATLRLDVADREANAARRLVDLERRRGEVARDRMREQMEAASRQIRQAERLAAAESRRHAERRAADRAHRRSSPRYADPQRPQAQRPADRMQGAGRVFGVEPEPRSRRGRGGKHDTLTIDWQNIPAESAKHIQPDVIEDRIYKKIRRDQRTDDD